MQETELTEMQADAADLSRRLERLIAKRDVLTRRQDEVRRIVGAAKWRCQQKDLVARIFETAQQRFHAKAVGSYEQLLTGSPTTSCRRSCASSSISAPTGAAASPRWTSSPYARKARWTSAGPPAAA